MRQIFEGEVATGFATGLPLDCHWTVANLSCGGLGEPPERVKGGGAAEQPGCTKMMLRENSCCRCLVSIFVHYSEIFFRKRAVDVSSASSLTTQRTVRQGNKQTDLWNVDVFRPHRGKTNRPTRPRWVLLISSDGCSSKNRNTRKPGATKRPPHPLDFNIGDAFSGPEFDFERKSRKLPRAPQC